MSLIGTSVISRNNGHFRTATYVKSGPITIKKGNLMVLQSLVETFDYYIYIYSFYYTFYYTLPPNICYALYNVVANLFCMIGALTLQWLMVSLQYGQANRDLVLD